MGFFSVVGCIGASLLALSCATPLDAPSAYADERFLCGAEHAPEWDALVSACNERYAIDGSCPGVASLKGELNGEAFIADSPLSNVFYDYDETKPTSVQELRFKGQAPYFRYNFSTEELTNETVPGSPAKCVNVSGNLFAFEVRGSSAQHPMNFSRCDFASSASGFHFAFSARFTTGGFIDGCAQFLATGPR